MKSIRSCFRVPCRAAAGIARRCARHIGFVRPVAAVTLACFVYTSIGAPCVQGAIDLSASAQANNQLKAASSVPVPAFALDIPMFLGRVTGGTDHGGNTLVINIQDLHCHAEVQRNISGILHFLDKKYVLETVFIEGGYGKLDTSWLNSVTDPAVKKQVLDALLASGRLTGGEYYSMTTGRYGLLRGLEDETLHKDNIVRLGKMLENKPRYEEHIKSLSRDLDFMKTKYLTLQNRRFNKLLAKYKSGGMDTARYYALLNKYVAKVNEHPEKYHNILALNMRKFPAMQAYLETAAMQKRLNYNRVSRQMGEFVQVLKTHLPSAVYNDILQKTDNLAKTDELYGILAQMIQEYKLDTAKGFPDLTMFFAYLEKNQAINALDLVKENQRLIEELRVAFSGDIAELEVSFLADFFGCYEDYLLNRLSADDYAYFQSRFGQFKSTWGKYTLVNHVQDLAADYPLLDDYYALNARRNTIFLNNMLPSAAAASLNKRAAPQVIVMVNGGFHTAGVTKLLDKRKISHLTITPNVTSAPQEAGTIYESITRYQAKLFGSQALGDTVMTSLQINVTQSNGGVSVTFANGACINVSNGACSFVGDWGALETTAAAQDIDLNAVKAQIILLLGVLTAPINPFKMEKTAIDGIMEFGKGLAKLGFTGDLVWEIAKDIAKDKEFQKNIEKVDQLLPLFQQLHAGREDYQATLGATQRDNEKKHPLWPLFEAITRKPEFINILGNPTISDPVASPAPSVSVALAGIDVSAKTAPEDLATAVGDAIPGTVALQRLTDDLATALADIRASRGAASLVLTSTYEIVRRVANLFLRKSKKLPVDWPQVMDPETQGYKYRGLRTVAQFVAPIVEENYAAVDPAGFLDDHASTPEVGEKRSRGVKVMTIARFAGFIGMAIFSHNVFVLVPMAAVFAYGIIIPRLKKDISATERRFFGTAAVTAMIAIVVSMHLNPLLLLFGLGGVAAHLGYNIINKIKNWNAELTLGDHGNISANIDALLLRIQALQKELPDNQLTKRPDDSSRIAHNAYQVAKSAAVKKYGPQYEVLTRRLTRLNEDFVAGWIDVQNAREQYGEISGDIENLEISLGTLWLEYQITVLLRPVNLILNKYDEKFPASLAERHSPYFDAIDTALVAWREAVRKAGMESDPKRHYETLKNAADEAANIERMVAKIRNDVEDDVINEIEAQFEEGVKKLSEASTFGDLAAIMEMAWGVRDDRQKAQQQSAFTERRVLRGTISTIIKDLEGEFVDAESMPDSVREYIAQLASIKQRIETGSVNSEDETFITNITSQANAIQFLRNNYQGEPRVSINDGNSTTYQSALQMIVENKVVVEDGGLCYSLEIRKAIEHLQKLNPSRDPKFMVAVDGFEHPMKFSQAWSGITGGTIELTEGNTLQRTTADTVRAARKAVQDALARDNAPIIDEETKTKIVAQIEYELGLLDAEIAKLRELMEKQNKEGQLGDTARDRNIRATQREIDVHESVRNQLVFQKNAIQTGKKLRDMHVDSVKILAFLVMIDLADKLSRKTKESENYQQLRGSLTERNKVYFDKIFAALQQWEVKFLSAEEGNRADPARNLNELLEVANIENTVTAIINEINDVELLNEIENATQKELSAARTVDDLLAILSMAQYVINNQQQNSQQTVSPPIREQSASRMAPAPPAVSNRADSVRADIAVIVKELEMEDSSNHKKYIDELRSIVRALDGGTNAEDVPVANIQRQANAIRILQTYSGKADIQISGAGANDFVDYGTALQRIVRNTVVVKNGGLGYASATEDAITRLRAIDFTTDETTRIRNYPGRLGYDGILKSIKNGTIILEDGEFVHVAEKPVGVNRATVAAEDSFSESEKRVLREIFRRAGFADGQINTILEQGIKYVESFLRHLTVLVSAPETRAGTSPVSESLKTTPAGKSPESSMPATVAQADTQNATADEKPTSPATEQRPESTMIMDRFTREALIENMSGSLPSASLAAELATTLESIFQRKTMTDAQKQNVLDKAVRLALAGIPVSAAALRFVPETIIAKKILYERHGIPVSITTLRLNPAVVIARKLVLMEKGEKVTITNLRDFNNRFPAYQQEVEDRVLTNLDQWQDVQWENLVQFATSNNYVFELYDGYLIPFPRFWSIEGKNASEEIERLFDMQAHAVIGPGMGSGEARSLKARFVMIEENSDMGGPGVVNFAVLKNGRWSTYTREVPPEELEGATIVILFNSGRARRPGGESAQAKTGPPTVNLVDPVEVEARDSVKELRPARIALNPLEMGVTWTSRHGTWAAYNNKYPIFPRREGKNKNDQFNHFVLARADVKPDGSDVIVPQQWMGSLEAIEDILDFQEMVNSSLPEGGKPYTAGVNGWFYSNKKGSVRGGASQNHAHAQILRFPFPIAHAKTTPVGSVNGIDMSVLAEGALNTGIVLETDRGNRQALARMMYETIKKITSIDADNTGRSFDYLVIPTADGKRLRAFIFDRTASKPQFHGNEVLDGEPAYAELGDALIVSNPDHFFKNKLPPTVTTAPEVAEWVKTQSQEALARGIDALDTDYFSQAQEALRGATADAEEVGQIAAAVLAETTRANTPVAAKKQQKPARKTSKTSGDAAVVADFLSQSDVVEEKVSADAVFICGNDNIDTFREALTLYALGKVKNIIVSGGRGRLTESLLAKAGITDNGSITEAEIIRRMLISMAVKLNIEENALDNAIILEKEATNTRENFTKLHALLQNRNDVTGQRNIQSVVFIQTPIQQFRAQATFNAVFADMPSVTGISFTIPPAAVAPQQLIEELWRIILLTAKGDVLPRVNGKQGILAVPAEIWESAAVLLAAHANDPAWQRALNAILTAPGMRNADGTLRYPDKQALSRALSNPGVALIDRLYDMANPEEKSSENGNPRYAPGSAESLEVVVPEAPAAAAVTEASAQVNAPASWMVAREALRWRRPGKVVVAATAAGVLLAAGSIAFFLTQAVAPAIVIAGVAAGIAAALTGARKQIQAEVKMSVHYTNNGEDIGEWGGIKSTQKDTSVQIILPEMGQSAINKDTDHEFLLNIVIDGARNVPLYGAVTNAGDIIFEFNQQLRINPDDAMRQISQALVARDGLGANPRFVKNMKRLIKMAAQKKGIEIPSLNEALFSLVMVDHVRPGQPDEGAVSVTPAGIYVLNPGKLSPDTDAKQAVDNLHGINTVSMGGHFVLDARDIGEAMVEQLIARTGTASLILTMDQIEKIENAGKNIRDLMQSWRARGKFIYVDAKRIDTASVEKYVKDKNLDGYFDAKNAAGPSLVNAGRTQKCDVFTEELDKLEEHLSDRNKTLPGTVVVIPLGPILEGKKEDKNAGDQERRGVMALQELMEILHNRMLAVLKDDEKFQETIRKAINAPEGTKAILRAA